MTEPETEKEYIGPERRKEVRPSLPRGGPSRRKTITGRRLSELLLTYTIVLFTLYVLSGYFIIPSIINNLLPTILSDDKVRISLGKSSFDPFTFMLDIDDLTIRRADDKSRAIKPALAIQDIHLSIELDSLFRKALICRDLHLNGVSIDLERRADLSYGLKNLDFQPPGKMAGKKSSLLSKLPPFSIRNITLVNGLIHFNDIPGGKQHLVEQILLNLPLLTNLEKGTFDKPGGSREQSVQPRFSAVINGSPIAMRGRSDSSGNDIGTRLDFKLHDLDLAEYLPYLPMFRQTNILSGKANLDLELVFANDQEDTPAILLQGAAELTALSMKKIDGSTITLPETLIKGTFSPLTYHFDLQEIVISKPILTIFPKKDGTPRNVTGVVSDLIHELTPDSSLIGLHSLNLVEGVIITKSPNEDTPDRTWSGIDIEVGPSGSRTDSQAPYTCKGTSPGGTPFTSHGTISFNPSEIHGTIGTTDLEIEHLKTRTPELLPAGLSGGRIKMISADFRLGTSSDSATQELDIAGISIEMTDLSFKSADYQISIPSIKSIKGSINQSNRLFNLGEITGEMATLEFSPTLFIQAENITDKEEGQTWAITSQAIDLTGSTISVGTLNFTQVEIHAKGLGQENGARGTVQVNAKLAGQGNINLSGDLGFAPLLASLSGKIDHLPLTALENVLHPFLMPHVTSGEISGDGIFSFPSLKVAGNITVNDLSVTESAGRRSISCPAVIFNDLEMTGSPLSLKMSKLNFQQPHFQVTLTDRKNPPIARYIFPDSREADISADTVTIENGSFQVIDHSTIPASEIRVESLTAKMQNMHNQPGKMAPFELSGSWRLINSPADSDDDQQSPPAKLQATGQAALFGINPAIDASITSSGININSLAPYLGPLIGYQPDRGNISIKAILHLADHEIHAANSIKTEKLSLGQGLSGRYNTPLAAAILTDQDGIITIDAPVSGKLKDNSFSYAGEIGTRIRDILLKTTLSPFSMLGIDEMYGKDSPDFLSFEPGISNLRNDQIERLQTLVTAINSRPLLTLTISGHVDPDLDLNALQNIQENRTIPLTSREATQDVPNADTQQGIRIIKIPEPVTLDTVIGDHDLAKLARKRGQNVRDQLLEAGITGTRITLEETVDLGDEILNRPGSRVDLDLHVEKKPLLWN